MSWFRILAEVMLLVAVVSSVAGQQDPECVIDDTDDAQLCVDQFISLVSLEDMCSILSEVRDKMIECESKYSGDCSVDSTYGQFMAFKIAFETKEPLCEDLLCLDNPAIDACKGPFDKDDVCAITTAEEDQVTDCVTDQANLCTATTKTIILKKLESTLQKLAGRKDDAVCNEEGRDARIAIKRCSDKLNENDRFISLERLCSVSQSVLNCYKKEIEAEPEVGDKMASHIAGHLDVIREFGCEFEWSDATLLQPAGCSVIGGIECYESTDLKDHLQYAWENTAIKSLVVQDQAKICEAVGQSNLGPVRVCLEAQVMHCSPIPRDGLDFSIDFLNLDHSKQLSNFCSTACDDAAGKQLRARQCLNDVDQTLNNKDCTALNTLINCVKEEIGDCALFLTAWRDYTQGGLAELASHCKTTIGVKECFDREEWEEEVRVDCMQTRNSFRNELELCSAYDSHISCILKRSTGCTALTESLMKPSLTHLAAINKYYDCELEYRGQEVSITESNQCALAHYGACFDPLIQALEQPSLQSGNLTTINALIAVSQHILEDPDKCSALQAVDTNVIKQCVERVSTACQNSAASSIKNPWILDMDLIDQSIEAACAKGCKGVNVAVAMAECGATDDLCRSLDIDATFQTPKGDQCNELKKQWTCVKNRIEKCESARNTMNRAFTDTCRAASFDCFGEVLTVVAPSPEPKPTATATAAWPQVGVLLVAVLMSLLG